MLDVLLTPEEEAYCRERGLAVNANKARLGMGKGGSAARYGDLDADANRVNSFRAECATAKALGLPYSVSILKGGDGGVDLRLKAPTVYGDTVQVKWRAERDRDIATDGLDVSKDLRADIYVLAWPGPMERYITLVGWATYDDWYFRIWDRETRRPPVRMRGYKYEILWQELRPMAELIEEARRQAA